MNVAAIIVRAATFVGAAGVISFASTAPAVPRIEGEWRQIASAPDLGTLSAAEEQPVDFAVWQARDGTWQLWSCIRNTREPGNRRLLYRWQGRELTDEHWTPGGIALHADPTQGETPGGVQAPFVVRLADHYLMFYGDWSGVRSQQSEDGKTFIRRPGPHFRGPAEDNIRDPMVLRVSDHWICYYSANPKNRGGVFARESEDLSTFGAEHRVANSGPGAGDLRFAAECPFVVEAAPGEFYLFSTQRYGRNAHTTVRYSRSPLDFLADDNVVAELPIAAPEIIHVGSDWFIAALRADLKGIQVARLSWDRRR